MDTTERGRITPLPESTPFIGGSLADCQKFILSIRNLNLLQRCPKTQTSAIEPSARLEAEDVLPNPTLRDDSRLGVIAIRTEALPQLLYIIGVNISYHGDTCATALTIGNWASPRGRYSPSPDHLPGTIQYLRSCDFSLFAIARHVDDESDEVWADDSFRIVRIPPTCRKRHNSLGHQYPNRPTKSAVWLVSSDNVVTVNWGGVDLVPLISTCSGTGDAITYELHLVGEKARFIEWFGSSNCKYLNAASIISGLL
ncbi:hypothetical protein FRB93_005157 [Tulasnella sp. JGI-2019a]|nr:hypothetical protein FRB93_005157 [Tulasnella sp. JGI-2019a]